jgi:hypothetical protein
MKEVLGSRQGWQVHSAFWRLLLLVLTLLPLLLTQLALALVMVMALVRVLLLVLVLVLVRLAQASLAADKAAAAQRLEPQGTASCTAAAGCAAGMLLCAAQGCFAAGADAA